MGCLPSSQKGVGGGGARILGGVLHKTDTFDEPLVEIIERTLYKNAAFLE